MRIGFVVNPIAGMGGSVGLKGTDGADTLAEAERRGAVRRANDRAVETLSALRSRGLPLEFLTCAGDMGASALENAGMGYDVVYTPSGATSRLDTVRAVEGFMASGVDLVLFTGGDGTARDIASVVGTEVPVVGVPAGVKMHSSVFALRPDRAADLVESFHRTGCLRDAEVMDVDEEDFRAGVVRASLFAVVRVPDDVEHLQPTKSSYSSSSAEAQAEEVGQYISETMEHGTIYILGPGSTTEHIARALGADKTPLGVDVYLSGRLLARDVSEGTLLDILKQHPEARVVVSPIGSQGFVFGRGNQQISPAVIRGVGVDRVIVVATPVKLRETPLLRVDTGDDALDGELRGPVKVVTGYRRRSMARIE